MKAVFSSSRAGAIVALQQCVRPLVLVWISSGLLGVTPRQETLVQKARRIALEEGVSPRLVLAVVEVESAWKVSATSPVGAVGLMQLMPGTARRFGVVNRYDPDQNLRGGVRYLRWLLERFHGSGRLALAGYNAGEAAVDRAGGVPPYRETQAYVPAVVAAYRRGHVPRKMAVTGPHAAYVWRDEAGQLRVVANPAEVPAGVVVTSVSVEQPFAPKRAINRPR